MSLYQVRIPAVQVNISKQYILLQSLKALGVGSCEVMTGDFLFDGVVAAVCIDIPPHGDKQLAEKKMFYGEPSKSRDEAIESVHTSALSYLQNEDVIFIDDANLATLNKCRRKLLEATFWSEVFQTRCVSEQATIAAMAEHIRLMTRAAFSSNRR